MGGSDLDTTNPAYKHGHAGRGSFSPEYHSWAAMMTRCYNPSREYYEYYGGRGIVVCERWKTFTCFLQDMGERPLGTSLDRIDPNGNYEPSNCRWATRKEQSENRRPGKWKQAEQKMLKYIAEGANTNDLLEKALASEGVILHPETVKELTRNLYKHGLVSKQRVWVGQFGCNVFKIVGG